jgi:hypothetical protein
MRQDWQGINEDTIDPFTVDIVELARASTSVYPKHYGINGVVPAEGNAAPLPKAKISNNIIFWCWGFTGKYTSISDGVDIGTCPISIKIRDSGKDVNLVNQYIPLDLMVSPGRVRTAGIAGDPSHQLFSPGFLNHIFLPDSDIEVEMASNALVDDNDVKLNFFGFNYVVPTGFMNSLHGKGLRTRGPENPRGEW